MKKAIVDISAVYWRNWHLSANEDISSAANKTLSFVRRLYPEHGVDNLTIAIDSPPYKRSEIYPEYKKNRSEKSEASKYELQKAIESILDDGVRGASCAGYEADDVIATLVKQDEYTVYGTDKDLLQCTDLVEPYTGKIKAPVPTLGIMRDMVVDYLALTGDDSDNIKGVKGIGQKTAVRMLEKYGSIKGIYDALQETPDDFTPSTTDNLHEAIGWIDTTRQIIQLSDDLELMFEKRDVDNTKEVITKMAPDTESSCAIEMHEPNDAPVVAVKEPRRVVQYDNVGYQNSLEPVGIDELWRCASALHQSGLYEGFAKPQGIMAAIMYGREVGLGAAMSVSSINVIKGKPSMGAEGLVALVKSKPVCEYLQCVERTNTSATWVTKRVGSPEPIRVTYTIEDAKKAGKDKDRNYQMQPAQMLMWRAASIICRMEYPDITKGMMSIEEMQ